MNIGAVKHRTNGLEGAERKEWFDLIIRPPFMQSATFSMHKNLNKTKDSEPDYTIWTNYNRKGEKFRGVKVGAVWKKIARGTGNTYFSGNVESPAFEKGILYFSLNETKVFDNENAADIDWIYDVNWNPSNNSTGQSNGYTAPVNYGQSAGSQEVPINYENAQGQPITEEEARQYMM